MVPVHHAITRDLVGYRVLGRHGELGTVVQAQGIGGSVDSPTLVVRGGSTERLIFYLPLGRVASIFPRRRTVISEVDVTDFAARLNADGTVELHLTQ